MSWIIGIGIGTILVIITLAGWVSCRAAGRADAAEQEDWSKYDGHAD